MLTKGLDNVPGTAGNDTIIGSISKDAELNTFSALDNIDGGAGKDTLKVSSEGFLAAPPATGKIVVGANVKNVEIVEASSAGVMDVDASAAAGVETLKVVAAVGAATAKAAATTDVAVTLNANTSDAITVTGGKNVSVELANAAAGDTVTVGVLTGAVVSEAAKGDVTVSVTGKAYAAGTAAALGDIAVNGGKTISVTQKATSDAAAAAADKAAAKVTQGHVAITADASTTTVAVKQDAFVKEVNAKPTTGGVTETSSVKFGALKATDSLTVNGLKFTAKVDMTAIEVASVFANLVNGTLPVAGDTQGSGLASKGTYTLVFTTGAASLTGWTSAAANGDTVVFTASQPNVNATDLDFVGATVAGSVAPVQTKVQGKINDATPVGGVMGVAAGKVTIAAAAALKTVTVDGYDATATGNGSAITGAASALETLNLSNGGGFAVAATAETLALNLKNVGTAAKAETLTSDVVTVVPAVLVLNNTTTKTLNVKSDGVNTVDLQLNNATNVTTLNVSGTGLLNSASGGTGTSNLTTIKVTETAGLSLNSQATGNVTSVDTTGTTGAVTLTIDGSKATYAGGAGKDSVTVGAVVGGVFNKTINLGAGDDTLDLTNVALTAAVLKAIPTANALQGGDGTDTLKLTAANAADLSTDAVFAGKIDGFEKLSVGDAATALTVNLANLDNINYVISGANASIASAAVDENALVTFQNLSAGEVVTVAGRTVTVAVGASATAADIAAAYLTNTSTATLTVGGVLAGWTPTASAAGVLKFTSTTAATNVADISTLISDTALAAATAVAAGTATPGAVGSPESTAWTMNGLTNGQSYTIAGRTVTANKTLTATEVANAFTSGTTLAGSYTVSGTYTAPTGWTAGTFTNIAGALTLTNSVVGNVTDFVAVPTVNTAGTSPADAVASAVVQGAAAGAGTPSSALTINNMASGGTLELTTAGGAGATVNVKDALTGTADVLNVVANAATGNLGTVKAAEVEAINVSVANKTTAVTTVYGDVKVAAAASVSQLALDANAAKVVNVSGAGGLTLSIAAATKVAAVDASTATGALTLDLSTHTGVAVTVTGGAGNDVLKASNAKADVLVGGAGADTLTAGANGAILTGGAGSDVFVLNTAGNLSVNSFSTITDFAAGDVLQLSGITSFAKLATVIQGTTEVSAFANAAVKQAADAVTAVYFVVGNDSYVVVDKVSPAADEAFKNGEDLIIKLTGVNLDNASFNSTHGTVALV